MPARCFPPSYCVEEQPACFVVRDHAGRLRMSISRMNRELLQRLADLECAIRMGTILKAMAPIVARSDADNFPERLDAMALIRETHSIRDFCQ